MAYCAQDDILKQISLEDLIQLTDDAGAGIVDQGVLSQAISDADAEIDSYCAARYTVPFSTVPAIIIKMSVDIAIYNLYGRRRGAPEDREKRYKAVVSMLVNISKGVMTLGASEPTGDDDSGPEASTSTSDRVFTKTTLSGY
jgi:phage gp36-like protein